MVVADTAFLIDVLVGEPEALDTLDGFVASREPVWIPAPTLHELYYGAGLHHDPEEEEERIAELEDAMPPLPFTPEAARRAGTLEARLERDGERPNRVDVQIAAVALEEGEPVVTRDQGFPAPRELDLETY